MAVNTADDFFGSSYIGLDPHQDMFDSRLQQLSAMNDIISSRAAIQPQRDQQTPGADPGVPGDVAVPRPGGGEGPAIPRPNDPGAGTATPPPPPEAKDDIYAVNNQCPSGYYNMNGVCVKNGMTTPNPQNGVCPSGWHLAVGGVCLPNAVPGNQPPGTTPTPPGRNPPGTTPTPPGSGGGGSNTRVGSDFGSGPTGALPPDLMNLRKLLGDYLSVNFGNSMTAYPGQLEVPNRGGLSNNFLENGFSTLGDLMDTGGVPDIGNALNAIRTSSMQRLDTTLAGLREKYGAMGLASGSDVNYSLAQGASQGIADMNKDQETLLVDTLLKGAANKLGAAQTVGAYAGVASANDQLNTSIDTGNIDRAYQDYLRQTNPSPWLQTATSYATGFPPPAYPTSSTGTALATAGIAAGGSILRALLPFLLHLAPAAAASDINLKTDIKPLDRAILPRLEALPISKWKYKGDNVEHIGPMAQDFSDMFGVGDRKNIALVDVMGVMLQATKELAHAVRN